MKIVGQHLLRCKQKGCKAERRGHVFATGSTLYRHLRDAHGLKKTPRRRGEGSGAPELPEWEKPYRTMEDENQKLLARLGC
jgi:hypothetical protein